MRRTILVVLAALVGFVGVLQVAPGATPPPEFNVGAGDHPDGAAAVPSAWYCPWVEAGDVIDSAISVASELDTTVDVTLLDPLTNTEPTTFSFEMVGPGATGIETGNLVRRGESPGIVEFSDGPAAGISMRWADGQIAADRCVVSVPNQWYLTGGATKTGTFTQLRLFNPFADNAEVTITAYSEFSLDLIPDLDTIDVGGRSWTTIDFEPYLPFRDELALRVTTTSGFVIPVLVRTDEHGEAVWNGTALSENWEFPVAAAGGLEPSIAVMSGGKNDIIVSVDIVTVDGTILDARTITLDSSVPATIPLGDLAAPPFGVRVRSMAPISATVVAVVPEFVPGPEEEIGGEGGVPETTTTVPEGSEGSDTTVPVEEDFARGLAGTTGSATADTSWIIPLDTLPGSETTLWLMNTGDTAASVEILPLGESEFLTEETVDVPPGSVLGIPVDVGVGTYGYQVSSDQPITAAWEIVGDRGVALIAGIHAE
ncbi:MAG: DUF5719 family protein [Actinomycetia bacterium]|nr:DUF5719 family protein [Actinomycetes bacterium]